MGESQNQPFQLSFNRFLPVDFPGSRVSSDVSGEAGWAGETRTATPQNGQNEPHNHLNEARAICARQDRGGGIGFRAKGKLKTEIPVNMQNRIIGIVGRKGSGKSTVLQDIVSCHPRVVIFDTMAEHPSPNVFFSLGKCLNYLDCVEREASFHCAFRPRESEEETLDELAEAVFNAGRVCFALEEVPWFSMAASQPEGLDLLSRLGWHRGIDLVWTGQRMADVSRRLTSATDVFVLLATTEPRDLNALAERCGQGVASKVQDLGLHGKLVYDVLKVPIVSV